MAMTKGRPAGVYASLRDDILRGRLEPGMKLASAMLISRYDVSVGAAREALQRLVEQELVTSEPGQGFRVVEVSQADLLDLTWARCSIEALVLKESFEHGDLDWESRVVAAHHRLDRTDIQTDGTLVPEWARVHGLFHISLLQACPNRRLLAFASSMRDRAELYRQWSIRLDEDKRLQGVADHRGLLDAALARDSCTAAELMVTHIRRTTETLLDRGFDTGDGVGTRPLRAGAPVEHHMSPLREGDVP